MKEASPPGEAGEGPGPGAPLCTLAQLAAHLQAILPALNGPVENPPGEPEGEQIAVDAFLSAAGVAQILDDYLQRDVLWLGLLAQRVRPVPAIGPQFAAVCALLARIGHQLRRWWPAHRRLVNERARWTAVVDALAAGVVLATEGSAPGLRRPSLPPEAPEILDRSASSAAAGEVRRLPTCFADFDQQPNDLSRLAAAVAHRWPERTRPVLVAGVRTSGSYLAPLYASFVRALGYSRVQWITSRPDQPLSPAEQRVTVGMVDGDGLALVVDDPPDSGGHVAHTAERLEALGYRAEQIVPVLALLTQSDAARARLARYPCVLLDWPEWTICLHLRPDALRVTLEELLVGQPLRNPPGRRSVTVRSIDAVKVVEASPRARGHVSALIDLVVQTDRDGALELPLHAHGIGWGYFAGEVIRSYRHLQDHVAPLYGARGGLLFASRTGERVPAEGELGPEQRDALTTAIPAYISARLRHASLPADLSGRVRSRESVVEDVAVLLALAFGASGRIPYLLSRPLARLLARRLLEVPRPVVVDGEMDREQWRLERSDGTLRARKQWVGRGRYSDQALHCADWTIDLASAAAELERAGYAQSGAVLREQVEQRAGLRVESDERWLLYRLLDHRLHLEAARRAATSDAGQLSAVEQLLTLERQLARVQRDYIAERLTAGSPADGDGPLCAIDIDRVLESYWAGFSAISPQAALALRALTRHGYRPVLATGRSLPELRERCQSYGLAGGVAEYGAALYDARRGRQWTLLTDDDRALLAAARERLRGLERVHLDPEHDHSVRAYTVDAHGWRSGLDAQMIAAALDAGAGSSLRAIEGNLQTDFVPAWIDKGRGLASLAAALAPSSNGSLPVAFAAGDAEEDIPMFRVAEQAFAPGDARPECRASATTTKLPGGSGLLEAVETFLGHASSGCRTCRASRAPTREERLLLRWLTALGGGRAVKTKTLVAVSLALLAAR